MTPNTDITKIMLHALWTAFKWPALVFGLFMLLRLCIVPIWTAIVRAFNR